MNLLRTRLGRLSKWLFPAAALGSPQRQERKLTNEEATGGNERCKTGMSESDRQAGTWCFTVSGKDDLCEVFSDILEL